MLVTLRDIQWRARRIVLGLSATALVLAMTALLGALHDSFLDETDRTVALFGADRWLVAHDVSGPFTSNSPIPTSTIPDVEALPGVEEVAAVAIFRHVVAGAGEGFTDVNVIAYPPDGLLAPVPESGRPPERVGEVMVDARLGVPLGRGLDLGGRPVEVVGIVRGVTYNGGTPTVLTTLAEGQEIAFDGQPLASALIVTGVLDQAPEGLRSMTPTEVRDDLRRPLSVATRAIGLIALLLWVVAAGIVAMMGYLSGLDRYRDFAVFKALGVTTRRLLASLVLQGALVSLLAGLAAIVLAVLIAPAFPVTIDMTWADHARLVGLALVVGVASSVVSVHGPVSVDPATAFANA